MSDDDTASLAAFLDEQLGNRQPTVVDAMAGGGSCEVFSVRRGSAHWVLRRAPRYASSSTAHDVLREFRILDAIKDQHVLIARPVLACADPHVFGAAFYLMEHIDGVPIRASVPAAWANAPDTQGAALEQLIDAIVDVHAIDWQACGLGEMARPERYLERQVQRWQTQLGSYGGRELPVAGKVSAWLDANRPADKPLTLFHGDYKLDNVLFAKDAPPRLLAIVDWEMAAIGDPLIDLAWALIFHPSGTMPLGVRSEPAFARAELPSENALIERYSQRAGRDISDLYWYDVFARWKLAIVLEGSYAKFLRGQSDKPVHEFFGRQADLLLSSASSLVDSPTKRLDS
ncbi:MAG: phosphotransferase family protein [Acidimicrobiales bacterium]